MLGLGIWDGSGEQRDIPFDPGSMGLPTVTTQWVSPSERPFHLRPQIGITDNIHLVGSALSACLPLQYEESQLLGVKLMTTPNARGVLVIHPGHLGYYIQLHLAPPQYSNSRYHWCFPLFQPNTYSSHLPDRSYDRRGLRGVRLGTR